MSFDFGPELKSLRKHGLCKNHTDVTAHMKGEKHSWLMWADIVDVRIITSSACGFSVAIKNWSLNNKREIFSRPHHVLDN